jgi:large subunit ribosomal protein L24
MKIKKGDKVVVIAGKDAGKTGTVTRALPRENRVFVEGVNLRKKHEKPRGTAKGRIVEREASLHVSNVMITDPKSGKGTRVGIARKDGKRVRVAKKSKTEF